MYYSNYYWGMNIVWWFIWIILLFWIFFIPYDIPFQRNTKKTPLGLLQHRLAAGLITVEEYKEKRAILENR